MTDNRHEDRPRPRRPDRAPSRGGEHRSPPPKARPPRKVLDEGGASADPAAERPAADDRIAKVIARAGLASRRDAEAMIAAGRVTLNGAAVTSPALNVGPDDRITVDGEPLPSRERTRLWLFHKPRGLVTTFRDPQERPTVFDALPDEMPRVVAIGRLDINTEGLLLLTNDGGLAKVIAHPDTGWTRRYKVRAHGDVTQAELDKLGKGVRIDDMDYGAVEARLDRVQGDNSWITLALREGKNREVKRILEHLGLRVNRLIRLSFGPFQLGELESGLVEEVRTRVLKDQLGSALAAEAEVDFESPVREPIAPFGSETRDRGPPPRRDGGERPPKRPRRAEPDRFAGREERAPREAARPRDLAWRADAAEGRPGKPRHPRRDDPRGERMSGGAERPRVRAKPIEAGEGRRVLVERVVSSPAERPERRPDPRARDRAPERPERRRDDRFDSRPPPGPGRGGRPMRDGPPRRSDGRPGAGPRFEGGGEGRARPPRRAEGRLGAGPRFEGGPPKGRGKPPGRKGPPGAGGPPRGARRPGPGGGPDRGGPDRGGRR